MSMSPKTELAELVADHLSQHASLMSAALGTAAVGLSNIGAAYSDAQQKRGNWGAMIGNLRSGADALDSALPILKQSGGPGVASVIEMGEREARFARLLIEEIERLTAGESTAV